MIFAIIFVFVIGYLAIALEHTVHVNKAAIALLTGVLCWVLYAFSGIDISKVSEELNHHFGEIAGILFFLLGAMTIVELIDAHDGFDVISVLITTVNKRKLLWIICFLSFFLSAVLDNLTATIVMITILRKLLPENEDRMLFTGMIVIASNAGGVWSPIGDVTTTMLWIGGQITAQNVMLKLILPSIICMLVPLLAITFSIKGESIKPIHLTSKEHSITSLFQRRLFFFAGLSLLLFVPVFKSVTHLPPFMGMLFGLGLLWLLSEVIHKDQDSKAKDAYSVLHALRKVDMPSIMFFLGILISIAALQSAGLLSQLAQVMNDKIGDVNLVVLSIGLLSSIVDNVPLVAASMGMYSLQTFPTDHYFWEFLAYSTGTGGSVLIIGSAAGVAAMGMEKINFFWYIKRISLLALLGYFVGAVFYIFQHHFLGFNN